MVKIINTSGKKKTAIARATLKEGKGCIRINKVPIEIIEPELVRLKMIEPVRLCNDDVINSIDVNVVVKGGGIMGQAGAVRTAIAKGLVEWSGDPALKDALLEYDRSLLVNDSRQKESKKFGGPGARAKRQKSYR
ncbi:MAG: small subunit ribosomal protein S9 [Candidatus Argoarchaeum ethanivorans]|uniref:Small ribosomal subunit protein uS9 n=1 Tax=Candidatus Argoarchaeum ethanivorans TaxID=2608793 RepID=A0A8B3S2M9_9EURY|nr:MAG: small subunit ribosomal protein S9 [Candidatus Argoarchaeum ethanivorans]